jgi:hypothetical protein
MFHENRRFLDFWRHCCTLFSSHNHNLPCIIRPPPHAYGRRLSFQQLCIIEEAVQYLPEEDQWCEEQIADGQVEDALIHLLAESWQILGVFVLVFEGVVIAPRGVGAGEEEPMQVGRWEWTLDTSGLDTCVRRRNPVQDLNPICLGSP